MLAFEDYVTFFDMFAWNTETYYRLLVLWKLSKPVNFGGLSIGAYRVYSINVFIYSI